MSEPTTIRVRVAVAITPEGQYEAIGTTDGMDDAEIAETATENLLHDQPDALGAITVVWIEADVPLPVPIRATLSPDTDTTKET